jgi:hypothetical protein
VRPSVNVAHLHDGADEAAGEGGVVFRGGHRAPNVESSLETVRPRCVRQRSSPWQLPRSRRPRGS